MSEQPTTEYTPGTYNLPPLPPAPKKQPWFKKPAGMIAVFGVACALTGGAIGAAGKPEPEKITVPGPERTVTKEVKVTPPECITAMGLYEQVVSYSSEALGYTKEAMLAASNLDSAGIYAAKDKMTALTPKIQAVTDPLLAAKASCRASAK